MNNLALIKFTNLDGMASDRYGLQETDEGGQLLRLYDDTATQYPHLPVADFAFVRDLGQLDPDDSDGFWSAIDDVGEIMASEG